METPGDFTSDWLPTHTTCRYCDLSGVVRYRTWESACGGFEDEQRQCSSCGRTWWVEGIDA
jgi:hypothetical protein